MVGKLRGISGFRFKKVKFLRIFPRTHRVLPPTTSEFRKRAKCNTFEKIYSETNVVSLNE